LFSKRNVMKNLNKVAIIFATTALTSIAGAQEVNNWMSAGGAVWKNVAGECWRNPSWTPATAAAGCDGAIAIAKPVVADAKPAQAAAPVAAVPAAPAAAVPAAPTPTPAPVRPAAVKVTYATDAFFDFGKSVLKPEGKAKLDDLSNKVKDVNLEVVIAVGHADSVGGDEYNQKLSIARSETVKAYLVSKGIEKNRIYSEGKGEKQPVADNNTSVGRAKNRRVEVEVVGTKTK
jgi:OmpA-OmpF porin, OOP family